MLKDKFHVNKHTTYDSERATNKAVTFSIEIVKYYQQCLYHFKLPTQSNLKLRLVHFKYAIRFLSEALQISKAVKDMKDKMMRCNLQYAPKFHNYVLGFVTPESVREALVFILPSNVCDRYSINTDGTADCVATIKDHKDYDAKCNSAKSARDSSKNYLHMWSSLDEVDGFVTLAHIDCHLARHLEMMVTLVKACNNNQ